MGVAGVAEVGAIVITVFAAVLGSSRIFVAKGKNIQTNQRVTLGSYKKNRKKERRSNKGKRHIPIVSTSSYPSSKDKFASGPRVAKLGIDEGMTTREEPSFMA